MPDRLRSLSTIADGPRFCFTALRRVLPIPDGRSGQIVWGLLGETIIEAVNGGSSHMMDVIPDSRRVIPLPDAAECATQFPVWMRRNLRFSHTR